MASEDQSILSCTFTRVYENTYSSFQFSVVKLKAMQLQWSMTINPNDIVNQRELELSKYRHRRQAWINAHDLVVIRFGFTSHSLRKWMEPFFKPITYRNKERQRNSRLLSTSNGPLRRCHAISTIFRSFLRNKKKTTFTDTIQHFINSSQLGFSELIYISSRIV